MSVTIKFETFEGSEVNLFVEYTFRDQDGRNVYSYTVRCKTDNELLLEGESLRSGCWTQDEPDCKEMIATLATFLQPGHGCYDSPAEAEFAERYGETLWSEVQDSFLGYHQLPGLGSCRIWYHDKEEFSHQDAEEGFYWVAEFPGCLSDSEDWEGPFDTPFLAYEDWKSID